MRHAQVDRLTVLRRTLNQSALVRDSAASDFHQQSTRHIQRYLNDGEIDATLETARSLRAQLVVTCGTSNGECVPRSSLEVDIRGVVADLRGRATHDGCERLDAVVIGDDHITRSERALRVVEGFKLFPTLRVVNAQTTGDLIRVEGVHRLAKQQHDVVGHICRSVDRAHAREHEHALHPERCLRSRINALNLAQTKTLRLRGLLEGDRNEITRRRRDTRNIDTRDGRIFRNILVLKVESGCDLASQATRGKRVPAVWGDVHLEDRVRTAEHLARILAQLTDALRQRDDAIALRCEAKLSLRGHHAVGDVAVGLTRGDLEATRQHSTRKGHHNVVPFLEVARTTDDALQLTSAIRLTDVHLAVTNGLLELRELLYFFYATDHERTGGLRQGLITLGFKTNAHETSVQLLGANGPTRVTGVVQQGRQPLMRNQHFLLSLDLSLLRLNTERLREAHVALNHVAHIRQAIAELQRALNAHTEGEALVLIRINANRAQNVRVDHAAATPLDPAGTTLLVREPHVHLSGRFREREVVGANTRLRLRAEQHLGQVIQRAAQVRHGQALVHCKALHLVEDRRVRGIKLIRTEHTARAGNVDRQITLQHRAHLNWRRMRAHHLTRAFLAHVERVLQRARRVIRDEVQRIEVEVLRLDLRAFSNFPTHADEDVRDLLTQRRNRVHRTSLRTQCRQRDVDLLLAQLLLTVLRFTHGTKLRENFLRTPTRHVHNATGILTLILRNRSQRLPRLHNRRLLAQVRALGLFKRRQVRGFFERRDSLVRSPIQVLLGQFNFEFVNAHCTPAPFHFGGITKRSQAYPRACRCLLGG